METVGNTLNLHDINCIPLLQELISYNPKGNFDRVMALMLCMFHAQENYKLTTDNMYDNIHKLHQFWNVRKVPQGTRLNSFRL